MTITQQSFFSIIRTLFRGFRQIMLQENALTGLLFLAGIFYGSNMMGLAAVLAVFTGTFTAKVLKYKEEEINSGLYGFSAALVGVALIFYFQSSLLLWLAICFGSILASVIQHWLIQIKTPGFTFPFILVTWICLALAHYFPHMVTGYPVLTSAPIDQVFMLFPNAIGQVIFQTGIWPGLLFVIGIAINRPLAALFVLVAVALSAMIAYLVQIPSSDIYLGLLGYNAVLCVIVFAGKTIKDIVLAFLSTLLSVGIMIFMMKTGLVALTFPFVLATWITLGVDKLSFSRSAIEK